jgi:hypothetical protein
LIIVSVKTSGAPLEIRKVIRERNFIKVSTVICLKKQKGGIISQYSKIGIREACADCQSFFIGVFVPYGIDLSQSQIYIRP